MKWNSKREIKWEYSRYIFDWHKNIMEFGENQGLKWLEMWNLFNQLGEDGWEMISTVPISEAKLGHAAGDTNKLMFIFKRLKQEDK